MIKNMEKKLKRIYYSTPCLYICSWDFWCAIFLTGFYLMLLSRQYGGLSSNILKDIFVNFGIYIPVLSIVITIFVLSITIVITALPKDFLLYLESHNHVFTIVKQYHIVGFYIYFLALLGNMGLQAYVHQLLPVNYNYPFFWYKASTLVEILYVLTVFLTLYSLFYTLSLIRHLSKLLDIRIEYIKKKEQSDDT